MAKRVPSKRPGPTPRDWANIPRELKALDQWVLYRKQKVKDKITKVPYRTNGRKADTTKPKTWASFRQILAAYNKGGFDGIGFVFTENDPFCGIDLDHCIVDGKLVTWAEELLGILRPCYVEQSPSGTGLHVIVKAKKPGTRCKTSYGSGDVEMYEEGRYFTITGKLWAASKREITDGQKPVDTVYQKVFGTNRKPSKKQPALTTRANPTEQAILEKARSAGNAAKFKRLWSGNTSDYASNSEADLALVGILAFWTGRDPALLASLYRQSALAQVPKNKAAHRGDLTNYVDGLVAKALSENFEVYDWDKDRKKQAPQQPRPMPVGITGDVLLAKTFKDPRWAIHGLLPEGLTIFGGKPKTGKSYKSMALSVAVATGGVAFSIIDVEPGEAAYLALEDSKRRIQVRLRETVSHIDESHPGLKRLHLFDTWPRIGEGGITHLREFLEAHPQTRLVIIDTFAKIRANKKARDSEYSYQGEYAEVAALKELADQHHIALVLVHHLRKAESDDVFDQLSGTSAIGGAADTLWVLKRSRGSAEAELWVTGRDIEEQKLAVDRDPYTNSWRILGDAERFKHTDKQQEIIAALEESDTPLGPKEIADVTSWEVNSLYVTLPRMAQQGKITRVERGKYSVVDSVKLVKDALFVNNVSIVSNVKDDKEDPGSLLNNPNPPSVIALIKQQADYTGESANKEGNINNPNTSRNGYKRYQRGMDEMRKRILNNK